MEVPNFFSFILRRNHSLALHTKRLGSIFLDFVKCQVFKANLLFDSFITICITSNAILRTTVVFFLSKLTFSVGYGSQLEAKNEVRLACR